MPSITKTTGARGVDMGHLADLLGRPVSRCDPRSRHDMPDQMKAIAAARAAITGLVDERADNVNAEPADGTILPRHVQIRRAEGERVKRQRIVDETYMESAPYPSERHGDNSTGRMRSMAVRDRVGEELFENDQNP